MFSIDVGDPIMAALWRVILEVRPSCINLHANYLIYMKQSCHLVTRVDSLLCRICESVLYLLWVIFLFSGTRNSHVTDSG